MRVAMLSQWHVHAAGYSRELAADPRVTITAVWDEIPERGKAWAQELGARFEENADTLLADPTIDAVAVCAPTDRHAELLRKAAAAGKHIFTEKILCIHPQDAYAIRDLVRKNHLHFTISFPHEANRALLTARKLVQDGTLGTMTYGRVRNVHSGSIKDWLPAHFYDRQQCGGGAMIDLGAHPMYLLPWFLGTPLTVSSAFTNVTDRPVEDNAVSLLTFAGGAIGVSETGFVSLTDPYIVELSGTKGYLCLRGNELRLSLEGVNKVFAEDELLAPRPMPIPYWIDSVENNTPNEFYTVEEAVALTELMDAAYRAAGAGTVAAVQTN